MKPGGRCLLVFLFTLLINFSVRAWPQATTISGVVLDAKTKQPVPFASISLGGHTSGTVSDAEGKFSFTIASNQAKEQLKISFIGYQTQTHLLPALEEQFKTTPLTFYLEPVAKSLAEVRVNAKARKITTSQVGYNIAKFSPFQHTYTCTEEPLRATSGQEVGIKIQAKKYPVSLQDFNFCLSGLGSQEVKVGLRLYALKNNLPGAPLLKQNLTIKIPPHHTGWITFKLEKYAITLQQDFAIGFEWLNDTSKLTESWLATAPYMPRHQFNYYKSAPTAAWQRLPNTSLGMYVTLVHQK